MKNDARIRCRGDKFTVVADDADAKFIKVHRLLFFLV